MKEDLLKKLGLLKTNQSQVISYTYTDNPTPDWDIERLLDQNPNFYRMPAQLQEPKKKKIIITDPGTRYHLHGVDRPEIELWTQLLKEGFEITVWTQPNPTVITNAAQLSGALMRVVPIDHEALIKKLAEENKERDDYYLAGIGQTKTLLTTLLDKTDTDMFLRVDDLKKVDPAELEPLLSAIPKSPTVGLFFSEKMVNLKQKNNILDHYLKNQQSIKVSGKSGNKLEWKDIATIFEEYPELESLEIDVERGTFNEELPPNFKFPSTLKSMVFRRCTLSDKVLQTLFTQCPRLEKLNLEGNSNLNVGPFKFPVNLKSVNYCESRMNWNKVEELCQQCPELESLLLYGAIMDTTVSNVSDVKHFRFPKTLKALDLMVFGQNDITWSELSIMMQPCTQLESLKLGYCQKLGAVPRNVQLPKSLKTLDLADTAITWQELSQILQPATQLESLYLINCSLGPAPESGQLFKYLKTLNLIDSKITVANTNQILQMCPQLESLNLQRSINRRINFAGLECPKGLKILDLTNTDITWQELNQILQTCPQLESLNLSNCDKLGDFPGDFTFPKNLKNLTLRKEEITWEIVNQVLKKCPQLESFTLSYFNNLGGLPKDFKLPEGLKSLNLINGDISGRALNQLLQTCPQLELLDLSGCYKLRDIYSLKIPKDVRSIILSRNEHITWQDVEVLLKNNPQLKYLKLDDCKQLDPYFREFEFPKTLEVSNHYKSPQPSSGFGGGGTGTANKLVLDSNTPNSSALSTTQIFTYKTEQQIPSPHKYRSVISDKVKVTEKEITLQKSNLNIQTIKIPVPVEPEFSDDIASLYNEKYAQKDDVFLGVLKLQDSLDEDKWIPLPSLSVNDKLMGINIDPRIKFELGYSKEQALYYIKLKSAESLEPPVFVSYMIQTLPENRPREVRYRKEQEILKEGVKLASELRFNSDGTLQKNASLDEFLALPPEVKAQSLMQFFNQFQDEKTEDNHNKIALLNTIMQTQRGVCRHRTLAFMAIAKEVGITARAVTNDIHAFVEIQNADGSWYKADLGGGAANLKIKPIANIPPRTTTRKTTESENKENVENKMEQPISNPLLFSKPTKAEKPVKQKREALALTPDNPFQTWDTVKINATTMPGYVQGLLEHAATLDPGRKNVLSVLDSQQMESFYTALLKEKKTGCFCLADLGEIKLKTSIIDDNNTLTAADSAFKKFLENAKPNDVVWVNWSDYQAMHVGYNSMMDAKRMVRGVPIPEGVVVMGVLPRHQLMGEDFYSRFRVISECPGFKKEILIPEPNIILGQEHKNATPICFYDDVWREELLGKINVDAHQYQYQKSVFIEALKKGQSDFLFKNAPWHIPEFRLFVSELLTKGVIECNGQIYKIPKGFKILRDDTPYELDPSTYKVMPSSTKTSDAIQVINTMNLNVLFNQYRFNNKHELEVFEGLIENNAKHNRPLTLFVTDTLPDLLWAKILNEAKQHKAQLHLVLAPNVTLPNTMALSTDPTVVLPKSVIESPTAKHVISNDIDFEVESMPDKNRMVFSINDKTTYADLFGKNDVKTEPKMQFEFIEGEVTKALKAGTHVVLKGQISLLLAKQLESLFLPSPYLYLNGERVENLKGSLTLVTDKKVGLDFVKSTEHFIEEQDYWKQLALVVPNDLDKINVLKNICNTFCKQTSEPPFNYVELKTMLTHMQQYPSSNPLKSLLRVRPNYLQLKIAAEKAWEAHGTYKKEPAKMDSITKKRIEKLKQRLNKSPYVFIAGPSGVGKSFTVDLYMKTEGFEPVTTTGMIKDKLKDFVTPSKSNKPKAIFFDEANLFEPDTFDMLEGLYEIPPRLLLDGVYYDVPPQNKIIFAGNFGHFKGRQQLNFVARHGNIITFKEFDDTFLREDIINPAFDKSFKTLSEEDKKNRALIARNLIEIYHSINKQYPEKHPLTARNLQMMVMRFKQLKEQLTTQEAIIMAAYDEASGVLNQSQRKTLAKELFEKYKVNVVDLKKSLKQKEKSQTIKDKKSSLIITKKRVNPLRVLNNLMAIRDQKINHRALGGTNGLILEGNPGIGKSLFAKEYLLAQGFVDAANVKGEASPKRFYHLQTTDPVEMDATLRKAFDEGAVVIIDEMNTLFLEGILNSLLSGTTPEGIPATHPGFFVIATQNPITFGNRSALSDAFLNRFEKLDLKDYEAEDLVEIVTTLNQLGDKEANKLVDQYLVAKNYAELHKKFPAPTPRDFFEKAKKEGPAPSIT